VSATVRAAPAVSVVMPVFNAARYVAAAVRSILAQTFADFELIAIDDGSTDESLAILGGIDDPRLRVVARPHEGVVRTMNAALALARAEIVARADADDVYEPHRLERQVAVLRRRPEVALVGAAARRLGQRLVNPPDSARIRWTALYRSPVANTTLVFRRAAAEAVGGYPEDHLHLDDYPFISRLADRFEAVNLPDVVVSVTVHDASISRTFSAAALAEGDRVRRANLRRLVAGDDDVAALFYLLVGGPPPARLSERRIPSLVADLVVAFRRRYPGTPPGIERWIGRQVLEAALQHGATAPRVALGMARAAVRLNPAILVDPRTARGLLRHVVAPRARRAAVMR